MLQNLTSIAFGGVSAKGIFVICLRFEEGRKECFVLAGHNFFVIWIILDILSYINIVRKFCTK